MRALVAGILLTTLAAPAVPAPPPPPRNDAYILAVGDRWMSGDMDLDALDLMRENVSGDFLWFRRKGSAWIVEDPAVLKKAEQCFEPLRALEPELESFRKSERALDAKEEVLDREQDEIEQDLGDLDADEEAGLPVGANTREDLEQRRARVESRKRELHREQHALESVERDLDAREEALEAEAERKLWRLIDESIAGGAAKKTSVR
jgi:hypothetical protein